MSAEPVISLLQLSREDLVALATFPIAGFFFACSTAWFNSVNRHTNKPLNQKLEDLSKLKAEAEELNRSSTILLHGKKMREVTKLEDEIALMRQRRNAPRRQMILASFYYFIQAIGLPVLYFICKMFGYRSSFGFSGSAVSIQVTPLEEIVMVPHFLTSYWISLDARRGHQVTRSKIPLIGDVRSVGFVLWYVMCMITIRVIVGAMKKGFESKHKKNHEVNAGNDQKMKKE